MININSIIFNNNNICIHFIINIYMFININNIISIININNIISIINIIIFLLMFLLILINININNNYKNICVRSLVIFFEFFTITNLCLSQNKIKNK